MASTERSEWGPDNHLENRRLLEVTRFTGGQLVDITDRVTTYLQTHPGETRAVAVLSLAQNTKEALRMQAALDIVNQLGVTDHKGKTVGRSGKDVELVRVLQDPKILVTKSDYEKEARAGEGTPHYWYDITWINPPAEKQAPPPAKPAYPFKTAEQRAAENVTRRLDQMSAGRRAREEARVRQQEINRVAAERRAVDEIIIDAVREITGFQLENGSLTIGLGEDGVANILVREYGYGEGRPVDRITGEFYPDPEFFPSYKKRILETYLRYYNFLAEQAEGKETAYSPTPLSPIVCEDAYGRAIRVGTLKVTREPDRGVIFQYTRFIDTAYDTSYSEMDLDTEMVDCSSMFRERIRPIHPDFAKFLRQKKAELDKT